MRENPRVIRPVRLHGRARVRVFGTSNRPRGLVSRQPLLERCHQSRAARQRCTRSWRPCLRPDASSRNFPRSSRVHWRTVRHRRRFAHRWPGGLLDNPGFNRSVGRAFSLYHQTACSLLDVSRLCGSLSLAQQNRRVRTQWTLKIGASNRWEYSNGIEPAEHISFGMAHGSERAPANARKPRSNMEGACFTVFPVRASFREASCAPTAAISRSLPLTFGKSSRSSSLT